ncbi:MAG: hypothetical protein J2P36_32835, partial [Ktedonobacteraceae bacterium]|nr:hypothetical protein [Ktedonobacteraceae bacterium]
VMLVRDREAGIEVFMVRRSVKSEFMPDVYVFPGGSVSADDRQAEQTPGLCMAVPPEMDSDPHERTVLGSGVRAAAIRELFEEANVLLAYQQRQLLAINEETATRFAAYRAAFNERQGSLVAMARAEQLTLASDHLIYFSHWITPEGMPRRYDTHFFLATAPLQQEAIYDQLETSDGLWIHPATALDRYVQGTFPIAFPTYHQLRNLTAHDTVSSLIAASTAKPVETHQPLLKLIDGTPHVYLPEDPGHAWSIHSP